MVRFAHLHCHSHFSLLEAPARIEQLCDAAVACGQDRLALTDHGNLFGAIPFYQAARQRGLTPILGCEINVVRDRRARDPKEIVHHLTLLAENLAGYQNLIRLVSKGYLEGFYFRPRVDRELLQTHAAGLVALSGCMSGAAPRRILAGDLDGAARVIEEHRELFGRESFFVELMANEIPLQRRLREGLMEAAARTGTAMVLTNDVHYIRPEESAVREVMMCIASSKTLEDENRWRLDTDQHHFRSSQEMATLFHGAERLCETTYELAQRLNVELPFGELHLPAFPIDGGEDPAAFFRRQCEAGCLARYGALDGRVRARLEHEIQVIGEMGFVAYFLIVADFVRHAREHGIPVGPGRATVLFFGMGITSAPVAKGWLVRSSKKL